MTTALEDYHARTRRVLDHIDRHLDEAPDLDVRTVSGDVAVRLPSHAGLELDAVTVSGRLETSFPDGGLDSGKRRLRGRIGDGGSRFSARTTSGDVIVLRRADATAGRGLVR